MFERPNERGPVLPSAWDRTRAGGSVADRKVYDYARGKYGVSEGLRDLPRMPAVKEPGNLEAWTAVVLAAFSTGLIAAYLLGALVLG